MPRHHDPTSALPTPRRILDIASGYEPALILEAAVRNGVFDLLHSEPLGLAQIAAKSGASQRGLRALLDGLVAIDLLERDGERYALTPESAAYLVTSSPRYQGYMCKHVSRHLLPRWMKLTEVVRSGQPTRVVNEEADGGAYFREFVEDIFPMSYDAATVLADELGLAEITQPHSLIDLAAGSGVWGVAMAQASQLLQVTAVDWAEVLPVTRRIAQEHGVLDQFHFIEGNILDADFGTGHQFAMLGHIIHSEGEQRSRTLLKKTFDALAPGGTVIIAEFVADEDRTGPAHALIFAVTMLVNTQEGDVFTFSEMAEWLGDAGFVDVRMLDVPGPAPLILATKPTTSR
jgi:ubiquinone/menaquinone biosynthesis C-methylase UbiE